MSTERQIPYGYGHALQEALEKNGRSRLCVREVKNLWVIRQIL